jgi:hypothetical protein
VAEKALIPCRLVKGRQFVLIGDSLTREWFHTLHGEFEHVLKLEKDDIKHLRCFSGPFDEKKISEFLAEATDRDCLIFDVGHHTAPGNLGMEKTWRQNHAAHAMNQLLSSACAPTPDKQVFFRTTAVRHVHAKSGDWNSELASLDKTSAPMLSAEHL